MRFIPVSSLRVFEEAVRDIRESVRKNLNARYSNDSSPEPLLHPNIVVDRVFPFRDLDASLIQENNRLHPTRLYVRLNRPGADERNAQQGESSLISYESDMF